MCVNGALSWQVKPSRRQIFARPVNLMKVRTGQHILHACIFQFSRDRAPQSPVISFVDLNRKALTGVTYAATFSISFFAKCFVKNIDITRNTNVVASINSVLKRMRAMSGFDEIIAFHCDNEGSCSP